MWYVPKRPQLSQPPLFPKRPGVLHGNCVKARALDLAAPGIVGPTWHLGSELARKRRILPRGLNAMRRQIGHKSTSNRTCVPQNRWDELRTPTATHSQKKYKMPVADDKVRSRKLAKYFGPTAKLKVCNLLLLQTKYAIRNSTGAQDSDLPSHSRCQTNHWQIGNQGCPPQC